jgi:hypothetical protein
MVLQHTEIVMAPRKRTAPPTAKKASNAGKMRYMQTRLAEPGWKALRMLSLDEGRPLQQLVLEGLNDLLKKYGKDQVVTGPDTDAK